MDGDRPGALMRRKSFTKRQQQMGGGGGGSSSSALAFNDVGGDAMEKARGGRMKSGQCEAEREAGIGGGNATATAEGDDGEPVQSPPATATITTPSSTCRKRVRLSGKKPPTEDSNAVEPASVPRKSRSAMKKRSRQLASPLLPDLKVQKKHCYIANGTDVSCLNGGARVDHNLLFDSVTEDEKEVVEALYVLSGTVPMSPKADKEHKIILQDVSSDNSLSLTAEKEKKVEPTVFQKVATDSGCQSSKPDLNGEPDSCKATPSSNCVQPKSTLSNNAVMVLTSLEVSHQYFENGEVQPAKYDPPASLHAHKPDNNLLPLGSREPANMFPNEVQLLKQNSTVKTEKYASMLQGGLSDAAYEQLTMLSASQSAICPGLATSSLKPSSKCSSPGTKKLAPSPLSATSLRKNCAIHIGISHLIRDYQEKGMDKQHILLSPKDAIKTEEKSKLGTEAASETAKIRNDISSLASTAAKSSLVERNLFDVKNDALLNGLYLRRQQSSILPETYAQQKQHPRNFSMLPTASGACGATLFGNDTKQSTQIHSSFLHPQVPQHATLPFHFTQIPNASQYAEKQVNLQLLPYLGNPSFYVQQPGLASNTKLQHQYQMWQAQVASCGSSMGIGVLQNGQLHDPSSFFRMSAAQSPSSVFVGVQGVTYRPPNAQEQLQLMSTPPLTSLIGRYHQEHHHESGERPNGSTLLQEGAPKVQLLCNVQRS